MHYFLLLWLLLWDIIFPWKCSKLTKFAMNLTNFKIWLKKIDPIEFFHFFDFGMSVCSSLKKYKNWRYVFLINIWMHSGGGGGVGAILGKIYIKRSSINHFNCVKRLINKIFHYRTTCRKILKVHSKVWDNFWHLKAFYKLWKMLFISPEKLFSFSKYSNFCLDFLFV